MCSEAIKQKAYNIFELVTRGLVFITTAIASWAVHQLIEQGKELAVLQADVSTIEETIAEDKALDTRDHEALIALTATLAAINVTLDRNERDSIERHDIAMQRAEALQEWIDLAREEIKELGN